jgi:hypothetical protein
MVSSAECRTILTGQIIFQTGTQNIDFSVQDVSNEERTPKSFSFIVSNIGEEIVEAMIGKVRMKVFSCNGLLTWN